MGDAEMESKPTLNEVLCLKNCHGKGVGQVMLIKNKN